MMKKLALIFGLFFFAFIGNSFAQNSAVRACLASGFVGSNGTIKSGIMTAQLGLMLKHSRAMDSDDYCSIRKFTMYYTPKGGDAVKVENIGARFSEKALIYVKQAKEGDVFTFTEIKISCPTLTNGGNVPVSTLTITVQ
ncbi:MAG: hypothetical protein MK212_20765 [Saprospiraceae bacterium]|nr:hypothetical protein [Saprospiraceae bacterium]